MYKLNIISCSYNIIIYVDITIMELLSIHELAIRKFVKVRFLNIKSHSLTLRRYTYGYYTVYNTNNDLCNNGNEIIIDMYKYNDTTYTIKKPVNLNC